MLRQSEGEPLVPSITKIEEATFVLNTTSSAAVGTAPSAHVVVRDHALDVPSATNVRVAILCPRNHITRRVCQTSRASGLDNSLDAVYDVRHRRVSGYCGSYYIFIFIQNGRCFRCGTVIGNYDVSHDFLHK